MYAELNVSQLEIDPTYQRVASTPQDKKRFDTFVASIVENFDPNLLGVLSVATDDGRYYVWDGQARLSALRVLGVEKVWCQIGDLSQTEQAALFAQQTHRRSLHPLQRHRAALVAGDKEATVINDIVQEAGLETSRAGIQAVQSLYWIYRRGGPTLLGDTLTIAAACWQDSPQGFSDRILKGLGVFLERFPAYQVDRDDIRKTFANVSPDVILGKASRAARTPAGSNNYMEVARCLTEAFNRAANRKLRFETKKNKK